MRNGGELIKLTNKTSFIYIDKGIWPLSTVEENYCFCYYFGFAQNVDFNGKKARRDFGFAQYLLNEKQSENLPGGEFHVLIQGLKLFDHEFFLKQFRMNPTRFEELLSWVGPRIAKSNLKRESIKAEERLCRPPRTNSSIFLKNDIFLVNLRPKDLCK